MVGLLYLSTVPSWAVQECIAVEEQRQTQQENLNEKLHFQVGKGSSQLQTLNEILGVGLDWHLYQVLLLCVGKLH